MSKCVIVTGGVSRLGKVIADQLESLGWRVLRSSHRPDAGADIVADLSDPLGAARLFTAACEVNGGAIPDALVNNAALFTGDDSLLHRLNYEAAMKLTIMFAGRETGVGSAVNILDSRVLGDDPITDTPYAASKRELYEYTLRSAVMFLGRLRVNAVAPGPVLPPVDVHELAGNLPLGRPTASSVADAVAFLLGAESTTGCVIPVDSGQYLDRG